MEKDAMISLSYAFMMSSAVDGGLTDAELDAASARFADALAAVRARHSRGELGFLDLADDGALQAQSAQLASRFHERGVADVIILGIGGSALGPIALRTALRPSLWNFLSDSARGGLPRLHVLDNVDPTTMAALLARVDLRTSLFVVISKSGSTAETMAQYLVARAHLGNAGLPARDHLLFVTDPARGALRAIARAEGIAAADIPPNVGGRFSVLSPVGILPASLIGIDVRELLRGASEMRGRCDSGDLRTNPAGMFAMLQWLADTSRGRHIHVLMPYADPLRDLAAWFVQLWAESLGKVRPDGVHTGPTPIGALGASDQHSQMQLFMEGPLDKTVTFITVADQGVDLPLHAGSAGTDDLSYLDGHRLGELLSVEQKATSAALAQRGRCNMTFAIDRIDPWHLGALFMLFEMATAFAGELYAVDAFNQPGVELAKRYTYALMGRAGFDDVRREWQMLPGGSPRYNV